MIVFETQEEFEEAVMKVVRDRLSLHKEYDKNYTLNLMDDHPTEGWMLFGESK